MAKSKTSKLMSSLAQLRNLFEECTDGFSDNELEARRKAFRTLRNQAATIQSAEDKKTKAMREQDSVDCFVRLSADEIGDTELADSIRMGGIG